MDKHVEVLSDNYGIGSAPITPQMFASAGREHMEKYGIYSTSTCLSTCTLCYYSVITCTVGTTLEHFAKIGEKNHRHSANNPYVFNNH